MGNGERIGIICGKINGAEGPMRDIVTEPKHIDITVPSWIEYKHPTESDHTFIAYPIEGKEYFYGQKDLFS